MVKKVSNNILIFSSTFLPRQGGLQYQIYWQLESIDKLYAANFKDLSFYFCTPDNGNNNFNFYNNIKTHLLNGTTPSLKWVPELYKVINDNNINIVHCHSLIPDYSLLYLIKKIYKCKFKIIVSSHGEDLVWFKYYNYGKRLKWYLNLAFKVSYPSLDLHILPSYSIKKFIPKYWVRKLPEIVKIPNGIPIKEYKKAKLNNNILCLSSSRDIKNLINLLKACSLIKETYDDFNLHLTVQDDEPKIKNLVKILDLEKHVFFHGEVTGKQKEQLFFDCSIYCLPSIFENCPLVILEAFLHSQVVIASRAGGIPELVEDGKTGILFDPNDYTDIAAQLFKLLKDRKLQARLRTNGLKRVNDFDINNIVREQIQIYRYLL